MQAFLACNAAMKIAHYNNFISFYRLWRLRKQRQQQQHQRQQQQKQLIALGAVGAKSSSSRKLAKRVAWRRRGQVREERAITGVCVRVCVVGTGNDICATFLFIFFACNYTASSDSSKGSGGTSRGGSRGGSGGGSY